jgi:hypothetical protein
MFVQFGIYVFICIGIIVGLHYFWIFIKEKTTIPKKKNIVNLEIDKYKQIIEEISLQKINTVVPNDQPTVIFNDLKPENQMSIQDDLYQQEIIKHDLNLLMKDVGLI